MNETKIETMATALQKRVPALERATALQLVQRDADNLTAQPQWIRDCTGDYTRYPRAATVDEAAAIVRDKRARNIAQHAQVLAATYETARKQLEQAGASFDLLVAWHRINEVAR